MSMEANHRVLIVDDNPSIHEDFRKILLGKQARNAALDAAEAMLFEDQPLPVAVQANFVLDSAYQGREALEKVQTALRESQPYAMAFVDVRMPPGWDGIETIKQLWQADPMLQVVVCTAYSDYSWDKMSEKLGVSDNLVLLKKPFDNVEVLQISHALTKKWLVTRQAQLRMDELEQMVGQRTAQIVAANAELRLSEERFSQAFHNSPIPQAIQTLQAQRFVDVNDAFLRMTGFSREEVMGRTPLDLYLCLDYEERFLAAVRQGRVVHQAEAQISTRMGELRTAMLSMEPLTLAGEPHILLMAQDITERLQLEAQLRQSQKMEAIGQLAAGIAHDFNNLLTIIQGHASLQLSNEHLPRELLMAFQHVNSAAERAADLTRKLLTFSRRGVMCPRVLDLNDIVQHLGRMLHRLLGEKVQLRTRLGAQLPPLYADATSVEQVLMNLVVNARDAMPNGGQITITTDRQIVNGDARFRHPEAREGDYLCLCVEDTGIGMDEVTKQRIFEPFFTTKGVNQGTGMGLATVYGIVKQHCGWVEVDSTLGKGTTFRVFMPTTDRKIISSEALPSNSVADDGSHTIFVVEDDDSVRSLVVEILRSYNYNVIEAPSGDKAIELWPEIMHKVNLLLTDMVMPGQANGLEVAQHCLLTRPDLKVIYTSGYSTELFASNVKLDEGLNYLPKPYFSSKLTAIIRNALDQQPVALV